MEGELEVGERQNGGVKKLDGLHWIMAKEKEKMTLQMMEIKGLYNIRRSVGSLVSGM